MSLFPGKHSLMITSAYTHSKQLKFCDHDCYVLEGEQGTGFNKLLCILLVAKPRHQILWHKAKFTDD